MSAVLPRLAAWSLSHGGGVTADDLVRIGFIETEEQERSRLVQAPSSCVSGETPHAPEPLYGSHEDHGLITHLDRSTDGTTGHSRRDNAPCAAGAATTAHVCTGRRYCPPF
ncbi:hypothetical protein [Streptomyces sp. NPDC002467]|uniref:hypothetical protein n=1 Tax=Streptomyces sp. NPDC002467 TaxID=3364647 RepID=UPI0036B99552